MPRSVLKFLKWKLYRCICWLIVEVMIHVCLKFVCNTVQHTVTDVMEIR